MCVTARALLCVERMEGRVTNMIPYVCGKTASARVRMCVPETERIIRYRVYFGMLHKQAHMFISVRRIKSSL